MKYLCTLILFTLLMSNLAFGQCNNNFYTLEEGREFELTNYDKKGKVDGRTANKIIEVQESGSEYRALVSTVIYDKKNKVLHEGQYEIICDGSMVKLDISQFFPTESMQTNSSMVVEFEGDAMMVPSELKVGEKLPGGHSTMTIKTVNSDMALTSADMDIINREVKAQEDITTPAGTYNCYKVTYDNIIDVKVMGMTRNMENGSATWFAEGVGVVKTENYDKDGRLTGYTLLTSYK